MDSRGGACGAGTGVPISPSDDVTAVRGPRHRGSKTLKQADEHRCLATPPHLTTASSRRPTASAALPLLGVANAERWAA